MSLLNANFCSRFVLALLLLLPLAGAPTVFAHEGRPVYIEVTALPHASVPSEIGVHNYQLKWKIPPVMQAGDEPSIRLIGNSCELFDRDALGPAQSKQRLIGQLNYQCASSENTTADTPELTVELAYPRANPVLSSLVVFNDQEGNSTDFFSGPEVLTIKISEKSSPLAVVAQYTMGGMTHIWEGYDHLLFVFCLIVLAGSFKRILLTVTGFTLAHTLTLILSTLGVVSVPIAFIELLIVLSVVVLAAEVLRGRRAGINFSDGERSLTWRYPVVVASCFGLLHGFGFASVLGGLGLPADLKVTALLFFNIGVELGQIAFILAVLVIAWLLRRLVSIESYQIKALNFAIYLVGVLASYWMFERLLLV